MALNLTVSYPLSASIPPIIFDSDLLDEATRFGGPLFFPPIDERSFLHPGEIRDESEIVWRYPPWQNHFIRERLEIRCSRSAPIGSRTDKKLLGFARLRPDAPPIRNCKGCWWRRVFRVADLELVDIGDDHGLVDPLSIGPCVPGRVTGRVRYALADRRSEHGS